MTGWVQIGPFAAVDASRSEVIASLVASVAAPHRTMAFDLHVSSLVHGNDAEYVTAVRASDLAYADGVSIVILGRLAGAKNIERAPLTDIGHDVLDGAGQRLERAPRLALVGGRAGLAGAAGAILAERHGAEVVLSEHGFHEDWTPILRRLREAEPDVVLVGLGIPTEATWCAKHEARLPACLIMTVGGWFGHVAGRERRAPSWAQRLGIEWVWRLGQNPRRLLGRYTRGALAAMRFALAIAATRVRRERQRPS